MQQGRSKKWHSCIMQAFDFMYLSFIGSRDGFTARQSLPKPLPPLLLMTRSTDTDDAQQLEPDSTPPDSSDTSAIDDVISRLYFVYYKHTECLRMLDSDRLDCPLSRQALAERIDEVHDRILLITIQDWHDQAMAEVDRQLLKCPQYSWLLQCDE